MSFYPYSPPTLAKPEPEVDETYTDASPLSETRATSAHTRPSVVRTVARHSPDSMTVTTDQSIGSRRSRSTPNTRLNRSSPSTRVSKSTSKSRSPRAPRGSHSRAPMTRVMHDGFQLRVHPSLDSRSSVVCEDEESLELIKLICNTASSQERAVSRIAHQLSGQTDATPEMGWIIQTAVEIVTLLGSIPETVCHQNTTTVDLGALGYLIAQVDDYTQHLCYLATHRTCVERFTFKGSALNTFCRTALGIRPQQMRTSHLRVQELAVPPDSDMTIARGIENEPNQVSLMAPDALTALISFTTIRVSEDLPQTELEDSLVQTRELQNTGTLSDDNATGPPITVERTMNGTQANSWPDLLAASLGLTTIADQLETVHRDFARKAAVVASSCTITAEFIDRSWDSTAVELCSQLLASRVRLGKLATELNDSIDNRRSRSYQ